MASNLLSASFRPTDLRCEYLINPINVGAQRPRLSWVDEASARGWRQGGYQILVARTARALKPGSADLWDSGRVESQESTQIEYGGSALGSRQACYWKVRIWDAEGNVSAWSPTRRWEMTLPSESDWQPSTWIGIPGGEGEHPAPFLRKEFDVHGQVRRARIYACGLGYAEIHANGQPVAPGTERDPGYTNFDRRVLTVAYDVTRLIRPGRNAIGAILGTGWYDVHDKATWNFDEAPWRGRPRLRLILAIDFADGRTQIVPSDSSWKATTGPIMRDGIYTGEVYDARRELPGWSQVGYDDHAWTAATDLGAPRGQMTPRACPEVALTETFKAKRITNPKPGVYIVDFGQNFSGHARMRLTAPAGTRVTMRYSERVGKDGMIDRAQIEQFMDKAEPPQPFQTDTYICKGGGQEVWEQRFSYSGFRFMEVTGLPTRPSLNTFEGRFAHTNLESAGEFACSNELFNRIQRATRYAYLSNAQNIPTDCPQREKNGWTGDAQLAAEAGLMNFQSATFYTKWLDDLADTQTPEGKMSIIVPTGGWGSGSRHPAWDSAFPIVAFDLYRYAGDTRILATHYDKLRLYVDSLATELKDGVLTFDSLGDWVPWNTQTPSTYTSTVYLYANARIMELVAKLLRRDADAAHFAALAEQVKSGVEQHFFANGTYANGSQTALSMALYFDLVPAERRPDIFAALVRNVTDQGHIDTGILGAKYVLRVLSEGGRTDLAYRLVTRKEQPGWGWWLEQGATTLWEDWKGESSLNHIMFGDVSNWFIQWIAGIGLDKRHPGFSHVDIHPQPVGDLTWASAKFQSPHGLIVLSWRKDARGFHLDVTIPANVTATVTIPGSGTILESGSKLEAAAGVVSVVKQLASTIVEVGSGTYSFHVRPNL